MFQCVKSKSVTNLAEATADPALELDAGGNPIAVVAVGVGVIEEGAVGGALVPPPLSGPEITPPAP